MSANMSRPTKWSLIVAFDMNSPQRVVQIQHCYLSSKGPLQWVNLSIVFEPISTIWEGISPSN